MPHSNHGISFSFSQHIIIFVLHNLSFTIFIYSKLDCSIVYPNTGLFCPYWCIPLSHTVFSEAVNCKHWYFSPTNISWLCSIHWQRRPDVNMVHRWLWILALNGKREIMSVSCITISEWSLRERVYTTIITATGGKSYSYRPSVRSPEDSDLVV